MNFVLGYNDVLPTKILYYFLFNLVTVVCL